MVYRSSAALASRGTEGSPYLPSGPIGSATRPANQSRRVIAVLVIPSGPNTYCFARESSGAPVLLRANRETYSKPSPE